MDFKDISSFTNILTVALYVLFPFWYFPTNTCFTITATLQVLAHGKQVRFMLVYVRVFTVAVEIVFVSICLLIFSFCQHDY